MSPPRRGTVAVVYAVSATGILANPLVLPVLPEIADDLGVGTGTVGLVIAAASFPGIFVAPLIGLAADRFGRRAAVVPCLVVFGAGGLAGAFAPGFGVLLATRVLLGVGAAGLINLAVVILGDHYDGARRATMIGRNAVVLTLGLSVFPTLGGALAETWGWRASFAPYGLAFVVAGAASRVLPSGRPEVATTFGDQVRAAGELAGDRRVQAMAVTGFAVFILVFGVATTLPLHLDEEFAAGALARGLVLALPAVGAAAVSLFMGRLARRFHAWDLVPMGFFLIALTYAGVPASPYLALVALPATVYGMGEALTIVPLQDYAAAIAPDEQRGVVVAVWVAAVRAGQTVGPIAAGAAIALLGTGGSFVAGSVLAGALVVVSVSGRSRLVRLDRVHGARVEPSDRSTGVPR